jgi:glycosyltransferase involved in cell wall biosynthesis
MHILYVCPFAHYTGHSSWSAEKESQSLIDAGANVTVLTYCGLQNDRLITAKQLRVVDMAWHQGVLPWVIKKLRIHKTSQRLAMFLETFSVLKSAIDLRKKIKIDSYHLRDGEPFPFLVQVLTHQIKTPPWVVTLTGTNLLDYKSLWKSLLINISEFCYVLILRVVNSKIWKYAYSNNKNKFIYITQNELVKKKFESYMGGVMSGRIINLPACVADELIDVGMDRAREILGLPQDKVILLSFGNFHVGKDIDVVLKAVCRTNIILLHAGHSGLNTDDNNVTNLVKKYGISNVIVYDYYIPENEKKIFFAASDGVILSYKKNFSSVASILWEATRYRRPVIASDNPGLGSTVQKYLMGMVFTAQDVVSLNITIKAYAELVAKNPMIFQLGLNKFADDNSMCKWGKKCLDLHSEAVHD